MNDHKTQPGRRLALAGAWLQCGLVVGFAGTVFGMMRAFNTLGSNGVSNPQQLADSISYVLIATFIGLVASMAGFVLLCVSIFGCGYRAEWVFWFLIIRGGLMLFGFPVGTVIGAGILVYCYMHRNEFMRRNEPVPQG